MDGEHFMKCSKQEVSPVTVRRDICDDGYEDHEDRLLTERRLKETWEMSTDEDWRTLLVEFFLGRELVRDRPELEPGGCPEVKRGRKAAVASVHGDCV